jgi:hypothetical protein
MKHTLFLALAGGLLMAGTAHAETTQRDLEVIGRAVSFMQGGSGSDRTVAIVYDAASAAEAEALHALMSGGMSAGRVTLTSRLVPASDASSVAGADAAIMLGGAASGATATAVTSQGVLTVSTDLGCVQSGACVMGVQSSPAVRILLNRGAASTANVSFETAFSMMVEEL